MDTVDRFSTPSSSASSVNESPRQSRSTGQSALEQRSRAAHTPASSTMAAQESGPPNEPSGIDPAVDDDASICSEKSEKFLAELPAHLEKSAISHELPTKEQLDAAADIIIYDPDGNARPFRHLFQGSEQQGQQQMIIFVRHFYCSLCQSYIRALVDTITPTRYFSFPIPTTITIIGCGKPELLQRYIERTTCPFRMYVDPTRNLYKALGMHRAAALGKKMEYNSDHYPKIWKDSFGPMFKDGAKDVVRGGHWLQVGGEFLFRKGKCVWCHRMKKTRDHAETKVLERILEATDEELQKPGFSPASEITPASKAATSSGKTPGPKAEKSPPKTKSKGR